MLLLAILWLFLLWLQQDDMFNQAQRPDHFCLLLCVRNNLLYCFSAAYDFNTHGLRVHKIKTSIIS